MEFLKELFTQPLTFEEFVKAVTEKGYKLADLSKGDHVAKGKLDEANGKIKTLTDDISKLNKDITELQNSNASAEDYKKKFEELQQKVNADNEVAFNIYGYEAWRKMHNKGYQFVFKGRYN